MIKTALPRALFVILLCVFIGLGCNSFNPFRWPPKLISERTWHLSIHKPASDTDKPAQRSDGPAN
jgi:hypothetical protein